MPTTSKNIQGNTELTVLVPLKPGLAPKHPAQPEDLSYPARLSVLLKVLFGDRKRELERDRMEEGLLEELQVIHSVQWTILGRAEPQLLLNVTFDGPWEPYIRTIVDKAGPVLDIIFTHCVGFEGNSCADGYQKFARWVREHQIETEFLFGAAPRLTVDDARFLQQVERRFASDPDHPELVAALSGAVLTTNTRVPSPRWFEKVFALYELAALFADEVTKFKRVAALVLKPEFGALEPGRHAALGPAHQLFLGLLQDPSTEHPMAWFQTLPDALLEVPKPLKTDIESRQEVQGSILTPYPVTTHGCYALVRFRDQASAGAFVAGMRESVTTEPAPGEQLPSVLINFGLTYAGLRQLGLLDAELAQLPKEFQEGPEVRAGMLGDVGRNHPDFWQRPPANWPAIKDNEAAGGSPIHLSSVDAVLTLQTVDKAPGHGLLPALAQRLEALAAGVEILHVQPTRRFSTAGHFGLEDGISQPAALGDPSAASALPRDQVAPGELLLGYPNQRGEETELRPPELLKNSTFFALRSMSQDVRMYRDALGEGSTLALGRHADGTPLEHDGLPKDPTRHKNDFSYPAAAEESRCPHFAHARRSNPRTDATVPRILRRGMSYGPRFEDRPDAPRGVVFSAFAASLAEQYEVVLRWVNAGNSSGVMSTHPDLIAGPWPDDPGRALYYSNALGTGHVTAPPRQLSTLNWSLYAFVPSLGALDWLVAAAQRQPQPQPQPLPAPSYIPADEGLPPNLLRTPPMQAGAYALEEDSTAMKLKVFLEAGGSRLDAASYWHGIAATGGARVTPFAVMVAARDAVETALLDHRTYSVRGYWARMKASEAKSYLGMDPDPVKLDDDDNYEVKPGDHEQESKAANVFLGSITVEQAFEVARKAGSDWLKGLPALPGQPKAIDLFAYARRIIRDVAVALFGLPDWFLSDAGTERPADGQVRCPFDLTTPFLHIFPPRPSAAASEQAVAVGRAVAETTRQAFAGEKGSELQQSRLLQALGAGPDGETPEARSERERRTLLGALSGFAVPTNGHLVSILVQLAGSRELWRLQREVELQLQAKRAGAAGAGATLGYQDVTFLFRPIFEGMIRYAVPERLQRTAVADADLGGVKVRRGDLLAVSIAAAAQQAAATGNPHAWKYLFGDLPQDRVQNGQYPVHRCPAQDMAQGVLLGGLLALLEHQPLTPTEKPTLLAG